MNLPNGLTVARIVVTPAIAALPFVDSVSARLWAFVLFLAAAITDWFDGYLARTRKQETDLAQILDPLADKLLLVGTFVPMYFLAHQFLFGHLEIGRERGRGDLLIHRRSVIKLDQDGPKQQCRRQSSDENGRLLLPRSTTDPETGLEVLRSRAAI